MERTDDFDKSDYGLARLAVEVWQGFVFVNLDADAEPLAPTLARYEPFLENYDLANAVDTVSVKNYVVVHPDMDEDLAYAVTRVMFEEQAAVDRVAPGVRQPNLGAAIFSSPLPLHPGAVRYYRERRD